ncbi:hypothetical protein M153_15100016960 [Pseudoloma neurophilia]|uniref:Uncharacterized protein n=1 Tax=Pseudoloma neurophilia TaxID=146866 RepID=A0A0R0M0B0_9MICR|nr:hypothetical protein M153_15100016960 [Pseudoloma neurophilia]
MINFEIDFQLTSDDDVRVDSNIEDNESFYTTLRHHHIRFEPFFSSRSKQCKPILSNSLIHNKSAINSIHTL